MWLLLNSVKKRVWTVNTIQSLNVCMTPSGIKLLSWLSLYMHINCGLHLRQKTLLLVFPHRRLSQNFLISSQGSHSKEFSLAIEDCRLMQPSPNAARALLNTINVMFFPFQHFALRSCVKVTEAGMGSGGGSVISTTPNHFP